MGLIGSYKLVSVEDLKLNDVEISPYDIFVLAPASKEYLLLIAKDEKIYPERRENISTLSKSGNLYLREDDYFHMRSPQKMLEQFQAKPFENEVLGGEAARVLKEAFQRLNEDPATALAATETVTKMADGILDLIVPDMVDLRTSLLKNLKNINLMNHTAAIISITIVVAVANDIKSRGPLQTLVLAALLMDASLSELEDYELDMYYRDPKSLPVHIWEKIKMHPVKSQALAAKLPLMNEMLNQLILCHHELHNGQGYHRGMRTNQALSDILSLGVDIYEKLQRSTLNKAPISFAQAVKDLQETEVDTHLRRHSSRIVKALVDFLGLD